MPFISVVPALRTPFGVDVFDYKIDDGTILVPGDLIRVPFRKSQTPALVVALNTTSRFADKAVRLSSPAPLVRLGPAAVALLHATARHTFSSQPTVLLSWIRTVPQRAKSAESPLLPQALTGREASTNILTTARIETVIHEAQRAQGRVLILTPWQQRAEKLAQHLKVPVLHADLADGAAWTAWTAFIQQPQGLLIATRIGGWLVSCADTVIVDEPENDDYKQDELAPRFDVRFMVDFAKKSREGLRYLEIGTTPILMTDEIKPTAIPSIDLPLTLEPWQRNSFSSIDNLSANIVQRIDEALEQKRNVLVLHPIRGERSRITCRDCAWSMVCAFCAFPLTRQGSRGHCGRCSRTVDAPSVCPSCGGSDLNKSRSGKDRLAAQATKQFGEKAVQVVDLPDWHRLSLRSNSLVILTDLSLIGGFAEDIRRRERLVIAWRRLAASVASAQSELVVQGPEELLSQARSWLEATGLSNVWHEELKERRAFRYPPIYYRVKLLITGSLEEAETLRQDLTSSLPGTWTVDGPFPVLYRSSTRQPRQALHLIPPLNTDEDTLITSLEPFAKRAIIDLDPLAFFS